ncbi:unnamed protein product, partial [Cyprideis torosa]
VTDLQSHPSFAFERLDIRESSPSTRPSTTLPAASMTTSPVRFYTDQTRRK